MANLIIKKSDTENISIPLTTEKPIARSLAVFKDGKIYYNPLVHSGEYLDSGVKVSIGDMDYALSTEIYEPTEYDSLGRQWYTHRKLSLAERGWLIFPGNGKLIRYDSSLDEDSTLIFTCKIRPTDFTSTRTIFDCYTNSKRIWLYVASDKKLYLSVNNYSLLSKTLDLSDDWNIVGFRYSGKTFSIVESGVTWGSSSKQTISTGNYSIYIGGTYSSSTDVCFSGEMSDVYLNINGQEGYLRFGD